MNSKTVKKFCKEKLGLEVRVRTIASKAAWIEAWIPSKRQGMDLVYSKEFPVNFREACLRRVYGEDTCKTFVDRGWCAGNVSKHSISLLPGEWELVIQSFSN